MTKILIKESRSSQYISRIEPAPEGIVFLGGVNDMPAESTGYFTAVLTPGKYALISEVPNTLSKNMLKTFVISD